MPPRPAPGPYRPVEYLSATISAGPGASATVEMLREDLFAAWLAEVGMRFAGTTGRLEVTIRYRGPL